MTQGAESTEDGPQAEHEGRDTLGRFAEGNQITRKGTPNRVTEWRQSADEAVTTEDAKAIYLVLVAAAKAGKMWAVKEFNDRMYGRPKQPLDVQANAGTSFAEVLTRLNEVAGDD